MERVEQSRCGSERPLSLDDLSLDDLITDRVAHEFADRVKFQLAHDVGAMCFRGLDANAQGYGNFLAALPFGQQLHDFALSRSQAAAQDGHVVGHGVLLAEAVQEHIRGAGGEERAVIAQGFDGSDQIAVGVGLHDVRPDPGLDNVADQLVGEVEGQDDDFRLWQALANAPRGLQAVQFGHADVHNDDIGLELLREVDRFPAGLGLGDNIPPVVRGQQLFEAAPDNIVIVSN